MLLYLCADEAELKLDGVRPDRVVRGKKRPLLPAPKAPAIHSCGYRIGSALERARAQPGDLEGESTGRSVAPHVRRAHWHRYWTGPRDGERRVALRWLSPILVASADTPETPTLRRVTPSKTGTPDLRAEAVEA